MSDSDLDNAKRNIEALRAAVAEARTMADEDLAVNERHGISATRQDFGGGDFKWHVSFRVDDFMTHICENDVRHMSDSEIAEMIWSSWDSDWDDVQIESPVGDFRVGSSDFKQRDSDYFDDGDDE